MSRLAWLACPLLLAAQPALALCAGEDVVPVHALAGPNATIDEGEPVRVRAVVTADFRGEDRMRGFFVQSLTPAADGEPTGLFVFAPEMPPGEDFAGGHEVVIEGRTGEFRGRPQLEWVEAVASCAEPGLPDAVELPFPAAERDAWHRYEGLLVRIDRPLTVSGTFELARHGTLVLSAGGRLFRPTQFPDGDTDNAARRILLDDGSYRRMPEPVPWLDAEGTRRVGSTLPGLSAVLTHAFGEWRLHPPEPGTLEFANTNPRRGLPPRPADSGRIAGFNVENYFLSLGRRGANDTRELARQRNRLAAVAEGLDADLLGLVEIENRPEAVADLATRLGKAAGIAGGYAHFALDAPVGTDAIRVALVWDPARVEQLGGPYIDHDPVHHRPPIAGHFRLGDTGPGKLVVVIHHKAKSGCPETGDIDRGQGCWNLRRTEQSRALAGFLEALQGKVGTDRVLIIGDINSYAAEDPVTVLRETGLRDLLRQHVPQARRYTYVFRGESGNLDVTLASASLAAEVDMAEPWPINADEPAALHDFTRTGGPWRSSDHDPVIINIRY